MSKIVVTSCQNFSKDQKKRLEKLGSVIFYENLPSTLEEYLERVKDADIICSPTAGFQEAYSKLNNVFVSVAFVSVAFVSMETLNSNGVKISNAPGANSYAVSEWILGMMIYMSRGFDDLIRSYHNYRKDGNLPPLKSGLFGKSVTILGNGNVGKQLSKNLINLGMKVTHFKRDCDLLKLVNNADFVVNVLSSNSTTKGLLNDDFFDAMKQNSYFIDVARDVILDINSMLNVLESGKLAGVATDCGGILVGDTDDILYQKLLKNPKVVVTPHISYGTTHSLKLGIDIMIDNVEAWINGNPQNLLN